MQLVVKCIDINTIFPFRILECERKIEEGSEKESKLKFKAENYEKMLEIKENEKENIIEDLKTSRNKNMEMTTELLNMNLQYNELENEHQNTKEKLIYLTNKVEEKQREMEKSKTYNVEQLKKNDMEEKIAQLNEKIKEQERKEVNYKKMMSEHNLVKQKLEKCEIELKSKEEQLENARSMLNYSETRIIKIEEFVSSQKERIISLEEKLQESEQVCYILVFNTLCF